MISTFFLFGAQRIRDGAFSFWIKIRDSYGYLHLSLNMWDVGSTCMQGSKLFAFGRILIGMRSDKLKIVKASRQLDTSNCYQNLRLLSNFLVSI